MRKTLVLSFICIAGALMNVAVSLFSDNMTPLYMDTIFTVTVTLLGGPFLGAITGALTNLIGHTIRFWGWEGYLFAICNIATAYITWLFIRPFPRELNLNELNLNQLNLNQRKDTRYDHQAQSKSRVFDLVMGRIVVLILLSFALCVAISILGGLISTFIQILNSVHYGEPGISPSPYFNMFPNRLPLLLQEILTRIPINIIDRLVAVFCGYGIALALHNAVKRSTNNAN